MCGETQASIYCPADIVHLCYDCDEELHAKGGKLVVKHHRMPISEVIVLFLI